MAVQLQKDTALVVSDLFSEMLERVESDMAYHKLLCDGFLMRKTIIFEVERGKWSSGVLFFYSSQEKLAIW